MFVKLCKKNDFIIEVLILKYLAASISLQKFNFINIKNPDILVIVIKYYFFTEI